MVMHEKKNLFSFGTIIQHLFSTWLMNLAKVSYWQSVSEILMCIVSKRFCSHAHHCGVADDAWFVSVFYASTMEKTPYFWWWMREYKQIRPTFLVSIHSTWPHFGSLPQISIGASMILHFAVKSELGKQMFMVSDFFPDYLVEGTPGEK